jgi:superfamily I DNA/RNA helicase
MANPESIIFNTNDVVVYLAAAGSGKTSALMDEMTSLLKTYRPDEIAFVTFTRKGVANGIERALQANPQLTADDLIHFRTLHALCFRELGLKHISIIEPKDFRLLNKELGFNLTANDAFDNQTEDDRLLASYDAIRSGSKKGIFVQGNYDEGRYERLVNAYEEFKKKRQVVDFYDCLALFQKAGKAISGVKVAFIDEAQDLTLLQWEVCQIAFSACEKIRVSGDDFQSLFTYAGASPRTLVSLAHRYKMIKLETSYRLPKEVYKFAKGITAMITDKIDKDFKPSKNYDGFVEYIADRNLLAHKIKRDIEKNGFTPYRWYLLFRNNCFIADMADILEQLVIPYHTAKGFCIAESDLANIKRFYNYRKQGYGSADAMRAFCEKNRINNINESFTESNLIPEDKKYVYEGYVDKYGIDALIELAHKEPFLLLSTTHRVKGGEADYVGVFTDCTRLVDKNATINIDEELRVLYVACTRSRLGLYIVRKDKKGYSLDWIIDMVKEQAA